MEKMEAMGKMEAQLHTAKYAENNVPKTSHAEFETEKEIILRLQRIIPEIEEIRKIVRAPSISFGVLHRGTIIFTGRVGSIGDNKTPDPDTLYHLGSVSKCFVSALVGIAVEEGKLGWKDLISTHLTDFDPVDDPEIRSKVRILDCLRHSSGIGCFATALVLGPCGNLMWVALTLSQDRR